MRMTALALALAGTTLASGAYACTYVPGSGYGDDLACAQEAQQTPNPTQVPTQAGGSEAAMSGARGQNYADSRTVSAGERQTVNGGAQSSDSQYSSATRSPMEMQQATDPQM